MKHLFTLLAFLIILQSKAQVADYLAEGTAWRQSSSCAVPYPCIEDNEFVYYLNGDSIVDSMSYQKLYKRGEKSFSYFDNPPVPPSCQGSEFYDQFHILIRQEEDRLYVRSLDGDTLLYDFDLGVGDTLPYSYNNPYDNITVTSIDSMLIGTDYRTIFHLDANSEIDSLVEGVGHVMGLLEPFPSFFECGYSLQCYRYEAEDHPFAPGSACDFNLSIQEEAVSYELQIYPNPAQDFIAVKGLPSGRTNYSVINSMGQLLISGHSQSSNALRLELASLPQGIYFLQFTFENDQRVLYKILKK